MKQIFVVFVKEEGFGYRAYSDTIKTGEDIIPIINNHNAVQCFICETRAAADFYAMMLNGRYDEMETADDGKGDDDEDDGDDEDED